MDTKTPASVDLEQGPLSLPLVYLDEKAARDLYVFDPTVTPCTIGPNPYAWQAELEETLQLQAQPQPFSWWWLLSVICAVLSVVWLILVIYVSQYFVIGSVSTVGVSLMCWSRTA
ncbi:hypothetical protein AURDEDRAFT_117023 [Auricularia subglabra TFB-10046 SS5]|uniref:Uncharacterized protein n=1 Tax=Auricularia subglabra (strain TFB-10046 / SS5) TaxID=717982 RepID=J0WV05_AURST|nr:hypothetical protein AURDEDRAFT_117023 [Auricularia subglabra TFB-10046 SS5]